jgi:large subunit ribosomal protein L10
LPNKKNIEQVAEIKEHIQNASAMWLVSYSGLTVKQAQELRRSLKEAGAELKIYKNTLTRIALGELELPTMEELLEGPNGFVFATGEDIAPSAKVIKTFMKENPALEIVGGLVGDQIMDVEQVKAVADLPSREELIAKLLGTLNNPATKIVRVLSEPAASLARVLNAAAGSAA